MCFYLLRVNLELVEMGNWPLGSCSYCTYSAAVLLQPSAQDTSLLKNISLVPESRFLSMTFKALQNMALTMLSLTLPFY